MRGGTSVRSIPTGFHRLGKGEERRSGLRFYTHLHKSVYFDRLLRSQRVRWVKGPLKTLTENRVGVYLFLGWSVMVPWFVRTDIIK